MTDRTSRPPPVPPADPGAAALASAGFVLRLEAAGVLLQETRGAWTPSRFIPFHEVISASIEAAPAALPLAGLAAATAAVLLVPPAALPAAIPLALAAAVWAWSALRRTRLVVRSATERIEVTLRGWGERERGEALLSALHALAASAPRPTPRPTPSP